MSASAPPGAAPATLRRTLGVLALLLLAALAVLRSWAGTHRDSFTIDEPWHIVAGVVYDRTGDLRLNPEHPPLVKRVVGAMAPADFTVPAVPVLREKEQERDFVEETMFSRNDPDAAQQATRIAMWSFHALLLVLIGALLWRAFGLAWALGALAFLAIEPTVGAHLPVVMTDLPLALTLLLAALCAGALAGTWQWRWMLATGLALGLALGSKHSAVAGVAGIGLALLLAALLDRRAPHAPGHRAIALRVAQVLLAAAVAWATLWALYGVRLHAALDGTDPFNRTLAEKIADVHAAPLRDAIAFADAWHLLPRAWLWGLADTVRVGIEGRGGSFNLLLGHKFLGDLPWFAWPAVIASKVPIALMLLAVLGMVALVRLKPVGVARWTLLLVAALALAHLAALLGSRGIWGGVRHALPLLVLLCVPAGACVALAWQVRSRAVGAVVAALFLAAIGMTVREPRLWEYHNELAGGTERASLHFANEGIDLGQRVHELRDAYERVIEPSGEPLIHTYTASERQMQRAGIAYRKRVDSMDDDNVEGIYAGYFLYNVGDGVPYPEFDWDPAEIFRDLVLVEQFGYVQLWHGTQRLPQARAVAMFNHTMRYIYRENGDDWAKVALRMEEVVAVFPQQLGAAVELANAYTRLGNGPGALTALRRVLDQDKIPVDTLVREQLEAQVQRLQAGGDVTALPLLRNPWLE